MTQQPKNDDPEILHLELIPDNGPSHAHHGKNDPHRHAKSRASPKYKEKRNQLIRIRMANGEEIRGSVCLEIEERLSDFINNPAPFIVILNRKLMTVRMLNKRYIVDVEEFDVKTAPSLSPEQVQNLGIIEGGQEKSWYGNSQ